MAAAPMVFKKVRRSAGTREVESFMLAPRIASIRYFACRAFPTLGRPTRSSFCPDVQPALSGAVDWRLPGRSLIAMPLIEPGQKAPDFSLNDQHRGPHSLAAYAGRPVVLYFYPKDDTPGCT